MLAEFVFAFAIVAVCVVVHTIAMLAFAEWLVGKRAAIQQRSGLVNHALLLMFIFSVIIVLHVGDTAFWALFYHRRGLFVDYETSLYFSLVSYTTIGYGDVVLPQKWRLLGGIEGVSGVLLCGLSTAFLFALVHGLLQIRIENQPVRTTSL